MVGERVTPRRAQIKRSLQPTIQRWMTSLGTRKAAKSNECTVHNMHSHRAGQQTIRAQLFCFVLTDIQEEGGIGRTRRPAKDMTAPPTQRLVNEVHCRNSPDTEFRPPRGAVTKRVDTNRTW